MSDSVTNVGYSKRQIKNQRRQSRDRRRQRSLRNQRNLRCEPLETRRLLVGEGDVFNIEGTFDTPGLVGDVSGQVLWGDGTTSPANISGANETGDIQIRFDYSFDDNNFFSGPNQSRRALLDLAAETIASRLGDTLDAVAPQGVIQYTPEIFHPTTGQPLDLPRNLPLAQNEIVIYAGARNIPGNTLGFGGPGSLDFDPVSVTCTVQSDCDRQLAEANEMMEILEARGQENARGDNRTDVATGFGSVTFDTNSNWFFDLNPDSIQPDQIDFVSAAAHEIAHVLGFGILRTGGVTTSWANLTSTGAFSGDAAIAATEGTGNVPITGDHWGPNVVSEAEQSTLLGALIPSGQRQIATTLDFAALQDLGWEVLPAQTTISAEHRFPDDGTFPVSLILEGSQSGQLEIDFPSAQVTNVAPTLEPAANQSVIVGTPLSVTDLVSISDPGFSNQLADPATEETFSYTIDWGDGSEIVEGTATIDRVGNGNGAGTLTLASFNGTHTYDNTGEQRVTVTVTDDDGGSASTVVNVSVTTPPSLSLELSTASIAEDDGENTATLTVRRSGPATGSAQTINLSSDDTSEATVPATAVIPADATFVQVPVTAVDDALLDGDITAILTATGNGLEPDDIELLVQDRESLAASFTESEIREDQPDSIILFVSRSNTDVEEELVVNVTGANPNQLNIPETITIEAGQRIGSVTLVPVNDDIAEAPLNLNFGFTAAPYASASASIELIDDEPPLFQNQAEPFDVNNNDNVTANDALVIINQLGRIGGEGNLDPTTEQPDGVFFDVNGDYRITALDALVVINEIGRRANVGGLPPVFAASSSQDDTDDDALSLLRDSQFVALF